MRCNHDLGPAASIDVLCEMCCSLKALLSLPRFANRSKHYRRSETQITSYSFEASGVNLPLTQCRITVSLHVSYAVELCKPVPFSTWSKVRNMSMGWLYLHQT
jgi:hypothetical protein